MHPTWVVLVEPIEVVISPKNGHGNDAIGELGGHYVMTATTLSQAEGDDITTVNDFRQVGIVVDPTNYGTSTVATASTRRQTFVVISFIFKWYI